MSTTKPTVAFMQKIVDAFYELAGNGVGGNLHIVTDDLNVGVEQVEWCREQARQVGDQDGVFLAELLLRFTEAEREEICLQERLEGETP